MNPGIAESHRLQAFLQKTRLLLRCLNEIQADGRPDNLQGDGRKAATGADVQDPEGMPRFQNEETGEAGNHLELDYSIDRSS